ncbi:MAG TPA: DinB family protein [Gemmatimonadaceae bacterium]|nr:DinB family protein [Gemmatimonadaceae bacterium]
MEIRDSAQFLDYLGSVHGRTRRVVLCIPHDQIEWAPAPGRFTLGEIVRHLAGIERWMYGETVSGRPTAYPGHGRELADGFDATLAYYDRLHEESRALFASLTPDALNAKCITPAGTPITTWKWLRAMIEHEAHHRGQLYMMLGLLGVKTPPIYGLTAEEVQAKSVTARA